MMSQSKIFLNDGLRDAAAAYAKQKSTDIVKAVQHAMTDIDTEMAENDNIYPHNGGKLNQRELCRRAGISYMTLQSPAHKNMLRTEVVAWLKSKSTVTKKTAAKAELSRTDHWKEQHGLVATQIHIYELALKEKDLEIQDLSGQVAKLEKQVAQSKKGRVVRIANNVPLKP
jgi:hypothetical protein